MKIIKKAVAGIMTVVGFAASLLGCGNHHMVDGPGMVNDLTWTEFTLSRSDSYAQNNFWITVERTDSGFLLTGSGWDKRGNQVNLEEGVRLSSADVRYLRDLRLGDLRDWTPQDFDEDIIILDESSINLTLTYPDGTQQKKIIGDELSLEIYRRFLPYF